MPTQPENMGAHVHNDSYLPLSYTNKATAIPELVLRLTTFRGVFSGDALDECGISTPSLK